MSRLTSHWSAKIISVLLAGLMLVGCGTTSRFMPGAGKKYVYRYELVEPVRDRALLFQDDRIAVTFAVDEAAVTFRLQNKTDRVARILWERVVIGVGENYQRVRHATDLYARELDPKPFPLPAGGFVRDLMMPHTSVYFDGKKWVEQPLFRTFDLRRDSLRSRIMANKGEQIHVSLPILFNDHSVEYSFVLEVTDVREIPWKDYVAVHREPRPPSVPKDLSNQERTVTIAIVVGFLTTIALFVTADKAPPSE